MHCKESSCQSKPVPITKGSQILSATSTLLLILVPKCPFCIMAYSTTFVFFLDMEYATVYPVFGLFKPVLIGLILFSILINFRGKRTLWAVAIITLSSFSILLGHYSNLQLIDDRVAVFLIFIGCWVNGNFIFVIRWIKDLRNLLA